MDNTVTICLGLDVTCASYEIDWLSRKGVIIPCEEDGCITIKPDPFVDPGSQNRCVEGYIICRDSKDGICHDPIYFKKCLCTTDADCGDCGDCQANGVCESICTQEELEQGKECTSDGCNCPPDKPYLNGITNKCAECIEDSIHPDDPCLVCKSGFWTTKTCPSGNCVDGDCKECATSDDCADNEDGRTRCTEDGCKCEEGYYFDYVERICKLIPPCTTFTECPDCFDCIEINGEKTCAPIKCPAGQVCIPGLGCVPECDCDDPVGCPEGKTCVNFNNELCYCDDDPCSQYDCPTGECDQIPGCKCNEAGDACITDDNPCAQYPCGTACADQPGCICKDGVNCVEDPDPCAKKSCDNGECADAYYCKCNGNDCESIVDPEDPDQSGCESNLTLTKGDCELRAKLTTNKCCPCADYSGLAKLGTYRVVGNQTQSGGTPATGQVQQILGEAIYHVDIKRGTGNGAIAINDLPSVYDATDPQVLQNEIPIAGQVELRVDYLIYEFDGDEGDSPFSNSYYQRDVLIGTTSLTNATGSQGLPVLKGQFKDISKYIRSLVFTIKVSEDIKFSSGCVIPKGKVLGTYDYSQRTVPVTTLDLVGTPLQPINFSNDDAFVGISAHWRGRILETEGCGTTEFKWYWARYDVNGVTTGFDTNPFRKVFVSGSGGVFEDYINNPDAPAVIQGSDNRGGLISGFGYKVVATCGCTGQEVVIYEGCDNPGRVIFCDPTSMEVTRVNCSRVRLSLTADCLVNRDLQFTSNESSVKDAGQVKYSVFFNGDRSNPIDTQVADINDGVVFSNDLLPHTGNFKDPIEKIEVVMNHDVCEDCVLVWEEDVDLVKPTYDEICTSTDRVALDFDITNTSVTSIQYNQVSYTDVNGDSIIRISNLQLGASIVVTYIYSNGCEMTDRINVTDNCCDNLKLTVTQDSSDCATGEYKLSAEISPNVAGTYNWYNNDTLLDTSKNLTLLKDQIDSDNIKVVRAVFVPNQDCDDVTQDFNLDIATDQEVLVNETDAKDSSIDICGRTDYNLTFTTADGLNGSIQYTVDGGPTLSAAWDSITETITVPVPAPSSASSREVVFLNNGKLVGDVSSCITLEPKTYNFNYLDNTTLDTIATTAINVCEGQDVKVTLTGTNLTGAVLTMTVNRDGNITTQAQTVQFNAALNENFVILTGLAQGLYQINATSITAATSGCSGVVNANQTLTFTVVPSPAITYVISSCTPGATTSTFIATITKVGTTGGTLVASSSDGSSLTVDQGLGTVSGTVQSNSTITVSLINVPGNCPDPQVQFLVDCNCPSIPDPVISDATYCTLISSLNLLVDNSSASYEVIWKNPAMVTSQLAYNVSYTPTVDGTYTVQFIDTDGCVSNEVSFDVSQEPNLGVTITGDGTDLCIGDELALAVNITGGTAPYTYLWNQPDGSTSTDATLTFTLASASEFGMYTVTVTDANGCTGNDTLTVTEDAQCDCDCLAEFAVVNFTACTFAVDLQNSQCNNFESIIVKDQLDATVFSDTFGVGNGNGYSTGDINATPGYTYTFTVSGPSCDDVSDSIVMNCTDCASVVIVPNETVVNETCGANSTNDGSIVLAPTGGTAPYVVTGDLTALNNQNLGAATYNITITDAAGCNVNTNIVVGDDNNCCTNETCTYSVHGEDTVSDSELVYTNGAVGNTHNLGYGIYYAATRIVTKDCTVTGVTVTDPDGSDVQWWQGQLRMYQNTAAAIAHGDIDLIGEGLAFSIPGSVTDTASMVSWLNSNTSGVTWRAFGSSFGYFVDDSNTEGFDHAQNGVTGGVTVNAAIYQTLQQNFIAKNVAGCGEARINYVSNAHSADFSGQIDILGSGANIEVSYNAITDTGLPTLTRVVDSTVDLPCAECN